MPIPKPKKGENRTQFISRCIDKLSDEDPDRKKNQIAAICHDAWENRGETASISMKEKLRFTIPITESVRDTSTGELLIKGIAINATVTRNQVYYSAEELKKAAPTIIGVPLLKDHYNSVDDIVGEVTNGKFDNTENNIKFTARVTDKKMQEKIENKLIKAVSVGCIVGVLERIRDEKDEPTDVVAAKNIEFVELSLVAVPADPGAGLASKLHERWMEHITTHEKIEKVEPVKKVAKENIESIPHNTKSKKLYSLTLPLGEKIQVRIPKDK